MQYGILSLCIALCVVLVVNNVSAGQHKTVHYTFGARVKGDHLLITSSDNYNFEQPRDAAFEVIFPASGSGSTVSYVQVVCKQDDDQGGAKIVAGGIGQPFITVRVEAFKTKHLSYKAEFYGTN